MLQRACLPHLSVLPVERLASLLQCLAPQGCDVSILQARAQPNLPVPLQGLHSGSSMPGPPCSRTGSHTVLQCLLSERRAHASRSLASDSSFAELSCFGDAFVMCRVCWRLARTAGQLTGGMALSSVMSRPCSTAVDFHLAAGGRCIGERDEVQAADGPQPSLHGVLAAPLRKGVRLCSCGAKVGFRLCLPASQRMDSDTTLCCPSLTLSWIGSQICKDLRFVPICNELGSVPESGH